jgi:hypothetical protein
VRNDLPLIVAQPGATLHIPLGFSPASAQVVLLGRRNVLRVYPLAASSAVAWTVPDDVPKHSFFELAATRVYRADLPKDAVDYVARLRVG